MNVAKNIHRGYNLNKVEIQRVQQTYGKLCIKTIYSSGADPVTCITL